MHLVDGTMGAPETLPDDDGPHAEAAAAFVRRVGEADLPGLERLLLFGSTVRGDAAGLASDVDFLAVVGDDADREAVKARLRDIAYDVMLDFGPVVEVHVLSRRQFERYRGLDHPFVRNTLREGITYV